MEASFVIVSMPPGSSQAREVSENRFKVTNTLFIYWANYSVMIEGCKTDAYEIPDMLL